MPYETIAILTGVNTIPMSGSVTLQYNIILYRLFFETHTRIVKYISMYSISKAVTVYFVHVFNLLMLSKTLNFCKATRKRINPA